MDNSLLVSIVLIGHLFGENIEVRLTHDLVLAGRSQGMKVGHVVDDEAAMGIFDEYVIGQIVYERP